MKLQKISFALVITGVLLPIFAGAQLLPGPEPIPSFGIVYVLDTLDMIVSWIFNIFLVVAVIFLLFAAFKYLMSGGDATKVGEATRAVIYAAVAIGVALLSASLVSLVRSIVGAA